MKTNNMKYYSSIIVTFVHLDIYAYYLLRSYYRIILFSIINCNYYYNIENNSSVKNNQFIK